MNLQDEFKKETGLEFEVDNNLEPKIYNYKYVEWIEQKLTLQGVVASLPSKEEMYLKELQEFKEVVKVDAAVSRIDFGAGFVKCYNWMVESRKSKG